MKNKIKYLVGVMIISLLFVSSAKITLAAIDIITLTVEPDIVNMGFSSNKPATITVSSSQASTIDGGDLIGITAEEEDTSIADPKGILSVTPTDIKCIIPKGQSSCSVGVGFVTLEKDDKNTLKVIWKFSVTGKSAIFDKVTVNVGTTTSGGLADLGDSCLQPTICSDSSTLNCTPCEEKPGLPCITAKDKVCLLMLSAPCSKTTFPTDADAITNPEGIEAGSDLLCMNNAKCDGVCVNDYGAPEVPTGLGAASTDLRDQIRSFINIALGFLGTAGAIIVLYGGVLWMTARGDDEQVKKAKSTIVSGVIGIIIILLAWTIVSYVLKLGGQLTT